MSASGIPPPQVIASWPKPNYDDPVTQGPALIVTTILFGLLAILIFSARLYTRFFVTRAPGVDDLFCGIGLSLAIANAAVVIVAIKKFGLGRHVWDEQLAWLPSLGHNQYAALWLNYLALGFIKVSILLFYRRLSVSFPRPFFIATWVGIAYNALFCLAFAIVLCVLCRPLNAYWLKYSLIWVAQGHKAECIKEGVLFPIAGILSCVGDFYTPLIPLALIISLSLPRRQKIALHILFALSFVIVVFGVIRTVILYRLFHTDYDLPWRLWDYWLWNMLELFLGICVASAPANKPLVQRWLIDPLYYFTSSKLSGTTFRGSRSSKRISEPADLEQAYGQQSFEINELGRVVPKASNPQGPTTVTTTITANDDVTPMPAAAIIPHPHPHHPTKSRSHTVSSHATLHSNASSTSDSDLGHSPPQQPWDLDSKRTSRTSTMDPAPRSPRVRSRSDDLAWPLPTPTEMASASRPAPASASPDFHHHTEQAATAATYVHASPLRSHPSTPTPTPTLTPLQYQFPSSVRD